MAILVKIGRIGSFLAAVKHFVPTVNLKGRRSLPWLNSTILQLIMKKKLVENENQEI